MCESNRIWFPKGGWQLIQSYASFDGHKGLPQRDQSISMRCCLGFQKMYETPQSFPKGLSFFTLHLKPTFETQMTLWVSLGGYANSCQRKFRCRTSENVERWKAELERIKSKGTKHTILGPLLTLLILGSQFLKLLPLPCVVLLAYVWTIEKSLFANIDVYTSNYIHMLMQIYVVNQNKNALRDCDQNAKFLHHNICSKNKCCTT